MRDHAKLIPHLIEATGPHAGAVHELPYGEHVVGRGGVASIALEHPDVSRRHARLVVGPDAVIVHDLGSKNGLLVQGKRVRDPVRLMHGQTITIGELVLRLSHPSSQVTRALLEAGETTVTTTYTEPREPTRTFPSLFLPLIGVLVFGALVAAMLLR